MSGTLFVIDGHSYIYHSFFGMPPLTNGEGQQVQAAYGITNLLLRLHRDENPSHWAIAMDTSKPTFRHEQFGDYKANRQAMPDDLKAQLPWIRELIAGFRIPLLTVDGFEADDILCTIARLAEAEGCDVRLVSKDKDLEQVLSPKVKIWDPKSGELFGPEELVTKKGITPDRVIEYLALIGDSSDNVPGVAGVGPKTALKVLEATSEIEAALEDPPPEGIPAPALKKIRSQVDQLRMSRELVTLADDVPIPRELSAYVHTSPDAEKLRPILKQLGFHKFLKELEIVDDAPLEDIDYRLVTDRKALDRALQSCREAQSFAVSIETSAPGPLDGELVGVALATKPGRVSYVPVRVPEGKEFMSADEIVARLRELFQDPAVAKIGHDLKHLEHVLCRDDIQLAGAGGDPMLSAYLCNPLRRTYGLDALASELLHHSPVAVRPEPALTRTAPRQLEFDLGEDEPETETVCFTAEELMPHAAESADLTLRLHERLQSEIEATNLDRTLRELELPLVEVLVKMEREGIRLDPARLESLEAEVTSAAEALAVQIREEAGEDFNISSPKQLEVILFDKLEFPSLRKTKTGRSTSADILEELAARHPERKLPSLLLEYRSLTKLLGTYIQALPRVVRPATGRIHTVFSQTAAATGRLSSSDPNLQNVPIKTELGRRIRQAFVPNDSDCIFLSADYSQIELRILAHICQDPELLTAMRSQADIHREVASRVHAKAAQDVTREERSAAKAVTFGVIYGMGAFGLARDLHIERAEAQKFIDTFFESFPGVKEFVDGTIAQARETREVRTLFGRRRPLPDIDARTPHRRQQAERFAVNTVVQGSAADLIKKAMIDVHRDLEARDSSSRMLLQIHDELLFEVRRDQADAEEPRLRGLMEQVLDLDVPLRVNISKGEDWYEASK